MKLIDNWRSSWRFYSQQAMVVAGALQGAYMALPVSLQARVPSNWVDALTIAVLSLGVVGRLVDQKA
jgi:hypothetical protein